MCAYEIFIKKINFYPYMQTIFCLAIHCRTEVVAQPFSYAYPVGRGVRGVTADSPTLILKLIRTVTGGWVGPSTKYGLHVRVKIYFCYKNVILYEFCSLGYIG